MARRLTPLRFLMGDKTVEVTLFDGRLASQVDLVLVDAVVVGGTGSDKGFYDRAGVYGEHGEDYPDNALRFAILARAAAELARQRATGGAPFDIVHVNDWTTALASTYLELLRDESPELSATRSVLTIHNVAHQGAFPKEVVPTVGLPWEKYTVDGLEFYGAANFLKQGILSADAVTVVSPTYAREIQTPEGGCRLDGVLARRGANLVGITNGVDYGVWNPATDAALAARYDAEDPSNKMRCKGALQKELGLPLDANVPLIASVGRLTSQKGTDLVAQVIPMIVRATEAQIVVAGDGDPALVKKLEAATQKSTGRAVFVHAAGEGVVHRMFGAADIVLVPSRFEPCGLVQMYAQRYGAAPVARATGGLVDTIVDCDAKLETGTGFLFEESTAEALLGATERAIAARTHPRWPTLVRRMMRLDRGWERPARQYEQLFRNLIAR
jgi:starch synthase